MDRRLTLRIIINEEDIRKLTLQVRPSTVEDLTEQLREQLRLTYDFKIQYEDPDFNNALCNLTQITDLPDKATLKIIPLICLDLRALSSPRSASDTEASTSDTQILSPASTLRSNQWPESFEIPNFSVDVAYRVRQGFLQFLQNETRMTPTWDMRHDILEKLAEAMYSFKAYPEDDDFEAVAKALISKHPCLTEPSPPGWYGWKNKLKYKMNNHRRKLRKIGWEDVAVNGGKKSKSNPEGQSPSRNVKRAKRGEANYLPNFPEGHDSKSLESARLALAEEMSKRNRNGILISQLMDQTFPYRRQEIVKKEPAVKDVVERWPALFTERQVFAEFNRIANKNIEMEFFEALDHHSPRLIDLFKSKKGAVGQKLSNLMQNINTAENVIAQRTLVLKGLPVIVGDDPTEFFKTSLNNEREEIVASVAVGVLTINCADCDAPSTSPVHFQPETAAVVIEGGIVMDNIKDLPQAFCIFFAVTYALHLDYPKCMSNTLKFIQTVMLGLGNQNLPSKLLTLKNYLLA